MALALLILAIALPFSGNLGTIYRTKAMALPFIAYFAACALRPWLGKVRLSRKKPDASFAAQPAQTQG
jgi:hypothetical protein